MLLLVAILPVLGSSLCVVSSTCAMSCCNYYGTCPDMYTSIPTSYSTYFDSKYTTCYEYPTTNYNFSSNTSISDVIWGDVTVSSLNNAY